MKSLHPIVATFLLAASGAVPVATATPATEKRPNILFILADDQSPFDLKAYDPDSSLDTPNISRLAAEGMVLDAAYHMGSFSGAVCTPSRHMIMSGRGVWQLPVGPAGRGPCPPGLEQSSLPAVFNRAGYDTMRTCKTGNSYDAANKLFTVRKDAVKRGGTAETGSAWHGRQVLDYLDQREQENDPDPFLIYFGFSHPHDTRDGTPELLAKYGATNHSDPMSLPPANPKQPRLPPNYLPKHPFYMGNAGLRDEEKVSGVWKNRDEGSIRNEIGREFACSENIDRQIGRVLDKLDAMGELENTYIIYTSDHGIAIGRHGLMGKQNLYEHTWRVPYIVKGPGIRPGSRAKGNIYLLDTLATLCDLAGIPAPDSNQGLSFKPVLEGKKDSVREVLYGTYSGGEKPGMRSVRKGDWKLIKYDVKGGAVRETQLFNLAGNPEEYIAQHQAANVSELTGVLPSTAQTNLASDPGHAAKLAEMEALLLAEMERHHDPYRLWNQPRNSAYEPEAGSKEEMAERSNWSITPDPALPNVLILGDSISIGYTLGVRKLLAGKANVFRPLSADGSQPENCEGSTAGIKNIDRWLAGQKWSVIHFNWGLHDMKHVGESAKSGTESDPVQAPVEDYTRNLETILGKLEATGAKLIFATTTPVAPGTTNPYRDPEAPARYNAAALDIIKDRGIAIDDLFSFCEPRLAKLQLPRNVHFKPAGSKALARQVAAAVEAALAAAANQ